MRRVIVESPLAGNLARNLEYARRAMRDSLLRGEAPFASHLLYAQRGILDDLDEQERHRSIQAGLAWGAVADATVVYEDFGISTGMQVGIDCAIAAGRPVEYRKLLG